MGCRDPAKICPMPLTCILRRRVLLFTYCSLASWTLSCVHQQYAQRDFVPVPIPNALHGAWLASHMWCNRYEWWAATNDCCSDWKIVPAQTILPDAVSTSTLTHIHKIVEKASLMLASDCEYAKTKLAYRLYSAHAT